MSSRLIERSGARPPVRPAAPAPLDVRALTRARRRRLAAADGLTVLAWTSAAVAVALWLLAGPVDLRSPGAVVTDLGIVAGLIGTDLVLLMLVLAARIPLVDRVFGHDAAMAVHRSLGKPALYLLLAHGALLIVGYALTDRIDVVAETVALLSNSDILLSVLGLGLMLAVVVTSLVAVRRLLPYEGWHAIHLLSYVAVLVALPHQLSTGQVLAEGWQRWYWIALYALAVGSIGWFRFVVPTIRSLRHAVVVERVEPVGADAVSLVLRGRHLDRLDARGGQFAMWRFWSARTFWHAHPLSLSAVPTDAHARITLRTLGAGTARLTRLRPGTRVSFAGPYGVFTDRVRSHPTVAVVAAGIGVTPVRAFLERLEGPGSDVIVLLRARNERETYLWDEVLEWAAARGARVYTSIGPRGSGPSGWLAASDVERGVSAATIWPDLTKSDLYICGPDGWADLVEADARRSGIRDDDVHQERFDW